MRSLQRLAGHFLDVVAGLPTLKVFGRAKAQARAIADVTDRYRTTTLATLKLDLPLLAHPRAAGHRLGRPRRRGRRAAAPRRRHELPRRALRPRPGARGLPAPARPRRQLPRQRRRDEGGRAGLRAARDTGRPTDGGRPRRHAAGHEHPHRRRSRSPTRAAASRRCTAPTSWSSRARSWPSPDRAGAASRPCSTSSSGCAAPVRARSCSAGWTSASSTSTTGGPASAGCRSGRTSSPAPWPTTSASAAPTPPMPRWRPRSRRPGLAASVRRLPHGVDTRARRRRCRPLGGRAPAAGPGPGLRARRAAARPRRADGQPRRRDRGRRARGRAAADRGAHRAGRGPPPGLAALADRVVHLPLPVRSGMSGDRLRAGAGPPGHRSGARSASPASAAGGWPRPRCSAPAPSGPRSR